jgi:hypothetical protein
MVENAHRTAQFLGVVVVVVEVVSMHELQRTGHLDLVAPNTQNLAESGPTSPSVFE